MDSETSNAITPETPETGSAPDQPQKSFIGSLNENSIEDVKKAKECLEKYKQKTCSKHPGQGLTRSCIKCCEPICTECNYGEHDIHRTQDIDSVRRKLGVIIEIEELNKEHSTLRESEHDLQSAMEEIEAYVDDILEEIHTEKEVKIRRLNDNEKQLLEWVCGYRKTTQDFLDQAKEDRIELERLLDENRSLMGKLHHQVKLKESMPATDQTEYQKEIRNFLTASQSTRGEIQQKIADVGRPLFTPASLHNGNTIGTCSMDVTPSASEILHTICDCLSGFPWPVLCLLMILALLEHFQ